MLLITEWILLKFEVLNATKRYLNATKSQKWTTYSVSPNWNATKYYLNTTYYWMDTAKI